MSEIFVSLICKLSAIREMIALFAFPDIAGAFVLQVTACLQGLYPAGKRSVLLAGVRSMVIMVPSFDLVMALLISVISEVIQKIA